MDIQTRRLRTIGQLRAFVEGNEAIDFQQQDFSIKRISIGPPCNLISFFDTASP